MNRSRDGWIEQAACRGMGPDMFAVSRNDQEHSPLVQRALAVCASCPVKVECEADMLAYTDPPYRIVVAGMRPKQARLHWYTVNDVTCRDRDRSANFGGTGGECGTNQGHQKHLRRGEPACRACKDAHNEHARLWRKLA